MRYSDWKAKYIRPHAEKNESLRHFSQNKFYATLLLGTLEKEFSCQSIIADEKFIGIVQTHVDGLRNAGFGYEHENATKAMASDPYKFEAYANFVKQLKENNYLGHVKIFRKSNNLAVQFDNVRSREMFEVKLGHEIFTNNKFLSGKACPQRDSKLINLLEFPYYKAGEGEPAVTFPSQGMRDKFYKLLVIDSLINIYAKKGQETTIYFKDEKLHKLDHSLSIPPPKELANTDVNYLETRTIVVGDELDIPLQGISVLIKIVLEYANSLEGEDVKPMESVKGKSQLIASQGLMAQSSKVSQNNSTNEKDQCLLQ